MISNIIKMALICFFITSCIHRSQEQQKWEATKGVKLPTSVEVEPIIKFDFKEKELTHLCNNLIKGLQSQLESWKIKYQMMSQGPQALLDFEEILANYSDNYAPLVFLSNVSKVEKLRQEAFECKEKSEKLQNEIFTTKAYYNILKQTQASLPSEERLLKETLLYFEKNGMKLNDKDLAEYKLLTDQLTLISIQFDQNLNEDTSTVRFTEAELEGVKSDFLNRLKKDKENYYLVTTKSPDYIHIMENSTKSETRKKMMYAYNNRQAEKNTPLLQKAIKIRSDMAKLLGFKTYADYSLQDKMAKNSHEVVGFLKGLKNKLSKKNNEEIQVLANFKKNDLGDQTPLASWDIAFLSNQLKIKKHKFDQDLVKEYFPAQHVINTTLEIYSQLLGVQFNHIKQAPTWAEQVDLFQVVDSDTKKVIAYFYADLIPREGKYSHAAAFGLIGGRIINNNEGEYQTPVASIVANFSPPTPGKPTLLSHDEIETFFHEFGHIMHFILTKAPYANLSGFNVKQDFVEAPSQMLENWVWETTIIKKMSQHYLDPKRKIPTELVNKMQKLKLFNSGITNTRQLVFGFFDMSLHTNPNLNVTDEYAKIQKELTGFSPLEGTHFPATFGHIMHGYAAGYYGYLWSKVYAEDMYSEFEKRGILNINLGKNYRKKVLEQGNMNDPLVLIKNFLGREPNNKAFFKSLGI